MRMVVRYTPIPEQRYIDTISVTALVEIPPVCSLKFLTCEQRSV